MKAIRIFVSISISVFLLLSCQENLQAGIVFEVETKDHQHSPSRQSTMHAYAEGKNLKLDILPGEGTKGTKITVIYRGELHQIVVIEPDRKSYVLIDLLSKKKRAESTVDKTSDSSTDSDTSVTSASSAVVASSAGAASSATIKLVERDITFQEYPCVRYVVLHNGKKKRELLVTGFNNIEGGVELRKTINDKADLFKEMMESFSKMSGKMEIGDQFDNGFFQYMEELNQDMKEMDKFPVVTRVFDEEDGSLESETVLKSAKRRTLDPAEFEPPSGYKRRSR